MLIQYLRDIFYDQHFFAQIEALFSFAHNSLINLALLDVAMVALNFLFCASIFYLLWNTFHGTKKIKRKISVIIIGGICVTTLTLIFHVYLQLTHIAYSLALLMPYFIAYSIIKAILKHCKNKVSKHVLKILKFDLYSLINWFFFNLSLFHYIPNTLIIKQGFIKFFVLGIFIIFMISVILLRRIILESIANKDNIFLKRMLKIFYSSSWLMISLFLLMWLSDESLFIKCEKCIISVAIFILFYLAKWGIKMMIFVHANNHDQDNDLWKFYRFVDFLFKLLLDPIIGCCVFYIWGINLSAFIIDIIGPALMRKFILMFILFCLTRTMFIFSNILVRLMMKQSIKRHQNEKRFHTFIAIISTLFKVVLAIVSLFFALLIYGVNPSPLLTNVWILAAGLTLGMQSVVKDLAVGVIMLFDDTFHIGDEVEVAGISGEVEEITLRVLKIRDNEGSLVSIPFSKVDMIANKSRSFVFMVVSIAVEIDANVETVLEILEKAGEQFKQIPKFKNKILSDIRILGPISVAGGGFVYEAKVKIIPMSTKALRATYYGICKELFDDAGIKFANDVRGLKKFLQ